jgi:PilZ domain-containing protein
MDRRTKPRLGVSLDAVWSEKHSARVTNLSTGGCFLDTVGEVLQGEIVGFRVLLPDDDWLYLEGEVRHYTPGAGFGVQFVDLNEEQEEKLRWLLRIAAESGPSAEISADLVEE